MLGELNEGKNYVKNFAQCLACIKLPINVSHQKETIAETRHLYGVVKTHHGGSGFLQSEVEHLSKVVLVTLTKRPDQAKGGIEVTVRGGSGEAASIWESGCRHNERAGVGGRKGEPGPVISPVQLRKAFILLTILRRWR